MRPQILIDANADAEPDPDTINDGLFVDNSRSFTASTDAGQALRVVNSPNQSTNVITPDSYPEVCV
jgi:hypothetical protein